MHADNRERNRVAGFPPGQGSVDVVGGVDLALRNGTPLIERGISCRGGDQSVDVVVVERFETNVPA
jgi:hypothetical protein